MTLDLHAEMRGIVTALDAAGIAYALVGGLAVSTTGPVRVRERSPSEPVVAARGLGVGLPEV